MDKRLFLFSIAFLLLKTLPVHGQVFYFDNKETTLVKTTDHSPVHWYINIYSASNEDETLQWKAVFQTIPEEWVITFDDQTVYHQDVRHNDSSDFILVTNPEVTQKLIIGAQLNNQVGQGTVSFEISDPDTPGVSDTIHFHFNISQGSLGVENTVLSSQFKIEGGKVYAVSGEPASFSVFDQTGRLLVQQEGTAAFNLTDLSAEGMYFFRIQQHNHLYLMKVLK
ncbi:T9SS type A sorting domain-containing protein [Crocinitomicaceae bacterium CZZ-1]|uniref:T9SS type A sorting domain-containing protein n=1 Tax=Taishania pollutisoli TaxID=2766479 RepID=A0A8J6TTW3_9FLAO|nr:T9SS type A sorting domain-containing protein [Taishania pollutisoli]MBC9813777.1 T9SS type A sorting domain-containing protein [Taishania pollutisoli]MBX2950802.1 T9SS type A sorting domain-containing protein [Crocinitomicaceae bacterium]NGF77295.1 T9SS type A sorting domain-containing protein [Fluviicola sp. SGL-29]